MRRLKAVMYIFYFFLLASEASGQLTYQTLRVGYDSSWRYKNLELIPVYFKDSALGKGKELLPVNSISLLQAIKSGKARVKELNFSQGGDVNVLEITNRSNQHIVVNGGEIISGGKQDRVVAGTQIIEPKNKDFLNVFCVEKGRWVGKNKPFVHKGNVNNELKKVMDRGGKQATVWKEIDRQFAMKGKTSPTWAYKDLVPDANAADTSYINFFTRKYKESDSSFAGFLATTGDRIISCDLYATTQLTDLSFEGLLSGLVQSVISNGSKPVVPRSEQVSFMDNLLSDEVSQRKFVAAKGKMFKRAGKIVHIVVYGD